MNFVEHSLYISKHSLTYFILADRGLQQDAGEHDCGRARRIALL